ncbi:MAG: hypothetical protein U5R46_03495 [Gammaproteobacteria bacterium]|nr:hypothetical protein [Gammaproteobacteria bacterium]
MLDKRIWKSVPAGMTLLAGCAVVVMLSGCASHGTPYGDDKVTICHKNKDTLVVPESAVSAHLAHGDTYGPCE